MVFAKAQLRDAVARDQNRAAIILWSVSNETPISPERNAFLKTMSEYARSLDSTRLITSASDKWRFSDPQTAELNDPLGEFIDVIGLNEYIGWYGNRKVEDADRINWKFAYNKPVIVSEFGADALYNLHGDAETRFTEEYQANLYQHQLGMLAFLHIARGLSREGRQNNFIDTDKTRIEMTEFRSVDGLVIVSLFLIHADPH